MMTLATGISIVALVLTATNFLVTYILTRKRDAGAIRPVMVFTYQDDGWHIENVGNGPALDVIFHRLSGGSITQTVRLPAVSKGGKLCLHFARHDSKQVFAATYRDSDSRPYTSQSQHDVSTVTKGFSIPRPIDVESLDRWWELPDSGEE